MKTTLPILTFCMLCFIVFCFAQGPQQQPGRGGVQLPRPSVSVTTPLPEQDVTLTLHLTSDQATALEKLRRDQFSQVVLTNGSTLLQPKNATLADQLTEILSNVFRGLLQQYPSDGMKAAQKAKADAAKAADDAAAAAGKLTKK